jgi:hypothetical protein
MKGSRDKEEHVTSPVERRWTRNKEEKFGQHSGCKWKELTQT